MPNVTIGDLLKSEADPNSRIAIDAPAGIKAGQPVEYPTRGEYLIALTDEINGQVLVQPHNCVMYANNIDTDALTAIETETPAPDGGESVMTSLTLDTLIEQGDAHGIKYISN